MKTPAAALSALEDEYTKLLKKHREVQLCGELKADLEALQNKLTDEGDLTNPKDVSALSECNAQLMMLPKKTARTVELFNKSAREFTELMDKALYILKDAAAEAAANVRVAIQSALQPFCTAAQLGDITERAYAVAWIEGQPSLNCSIPLHADFTDPIKVENLNHSLAELKIKLGYATQKGGFLAAFQKTQQ